MNVKRCLCRSFKKRFRTVHTQKYVHNSCNNIEAVIPTTLPKYTFSIVVFLSLHWIAWFIICYLATPISKAQSILHITTKPRNQWRMIWLLELVKANQISYNISATASSNQSTSNHYYCKYTQDLNTRVNSRLQNPQLDFSFSSPTKQNSVTSTLEHYDSLLW